MAYFSNGTEGQCFDEQCSKCIFGNKPCSIASVQMNYNYDAVGNKIATSILNSLVRNDGTCEMFKWNKDIMQLNNNEEKEIAERYKKLLSEQNKKEVK